MAGPSGMISGVTVAAASAGMPGGTVVGASRIVAGVTMAGLPGVGEAVAVAGAFVVTTVAAGDGASLAQAATAQNVETNMNVGSTLRHRGSHRGRAVVFIRQCYTNRHSCRYFWRGRLS